MNALRMLAGEPWVGRLGWALIHFLWQGGLIASLYAICNDIAISITGDAVVYAEALADLEASRPAHLSPAMAANGGSLEGRIARLLDIQDGQIAWAPAPGAIFGLLFCMVVAVVAQPAASQ